MSRQRGREKPLKKVKGFNVHEGESILMVGRPSIAVVWPKYLLTLGLYGLWRKRNVSVLTDRRVLVGKGIVSRTEHSTPIAQINDAMYVRKGLSAYCEVASVLRGRDHVQRLGPLSPHQARQLTEAIVDRRLT